MTIPDDVVAISNTTESNVVNTVTDSETTADGTVVATVSENNSENIENAAESIESGTGTSSNVPVNNTDNISEDDVIVAESDDVIPVTNIVEVRNVELVTEDLTFDENHFSTPTGGTPNRSPRTRRRRTTASSLDESEVRNDRPVRDTMFIVYIIIQF